MIRLARLDEVAVSELAALLADLGGGENGFGGSPVHAEGMAIEAYAARCRAAEDEQGLAPGRVPETHFVLMEGDRAAGLVRVRHRLNANLRRHGGHVGYYVRPAFRGRGLARRGLAQALDYLRELGERYALVTVDDDNFASIAVVESCGGVLEDKLELGELGVLARRYRIKLERS